MIGSAREHSRCAGAKEIKARRKPALMHSSSPFSMQAQINLTASQRPTNEKLFSSSSPSLLQRAGETFLSDVVNEKGMTKKALFCTKEERISFHDDEYGPFLFWPVVPGKTLAVVIVFSFCLRKKQTFFLLMLDTQLQLAAERQLWSLLPDVLRMFSVLPSEPYKRCLFGICCDLIDSYSLYAIFFS